MTIVLLTILVSLVLLFIRTQDSMYRAENEAKKIISVDYEVKSVNNFYWSTTDATYFALDFLDKKGVQRYAIIAQKGGEASYYETSDIITEDEAYSVVLNDMKPYKIIQMRLSLIDEQPVWEATIKNENGTITYYIISAYDGSWVQTIENI